MDPKKGPPFAMVVSEGMRSRGFTLRGLCREAGLDPSFFSKILSGKRSPPAEEDVLRRLAELLGLEAAELIVAAGRIPSEWHALWSDPTLLRDIHARASGARRGPERSWGDRPLVPTAAKIPLKPTPQLRHSGGLSEELL